MEYVTSKWVNGWIDCGGPYRPSYGTWIVSLGVGKPVLRRRTMIRSLFLEDHIDGCLRNSCESVRAVLGFSRETEPIRCIICRKKFIIKNWLIQLVK